MEERYRSRHSKQTMIVGKWILKALVAEWTMKGPELECDTRHHILELRAKRPLKGEHTLLQQYHESAYWEQVNQRLLVEN